MVRQVAFRGRERQVRCFGTHATPGGSHPSPSLEGEVMAESRRRVRAAQGTVFISDRARPQFAIGDRCEDRCEAGRGQMRI